MVMTVVLVMIMSLVVILPTTSYALFPRYYPVIRTFPIGGGNIGSNGGSGSHSGYHGPIYQPQMFYIPSGGGGGGGSSGGGTSTFSTPSGNGNGQPQAVVTEYSNGAVYQSTPYGTIGHGGVHVPVRTTTTSGQSTSTPTVITKTITITKTYTQYVYDTYEVNHYIYEYMYPIIQWVFTLVNIGQYQQPGYHSIGSEKLFTPGYGSGSGIFVPVYAQEAVYVFNYAPSTKPQITGWYTGKTSQSTSGPFLVSQSSTPPQLSSIQDTVNNAGQAVNNIQQLATTNPNGLASMTYVYYSGTNTIFNTITNTVTKIENLKPYYYSDPNQNFALALQSLLQGNIAGAAYYTGKGIYENLWNDFAWTTQQLYSIVTVASNAWNTATLAKSVAASIYGGVEGVGNALGQMFTKSWWNWPL
jgi:hypothetical protein